MSGLTFHLCLACLLSIILSGFILVVACVGIAFFLLNHILLSTDCMYVSFHLPACPWLASPNPGVPRGIGYIFRSGIS